jgi:hypothetical protein
MTWEEFEDFVNRGRRAQRAVDAALATGEHAFVGGYEIDPSQPNRCQVCGRPSDDHPPRRKSGGGQHHGHRRGRP